MIHSLKETETMKKTKIFKELNFEVSAMVVPRLTKITLNMGVESNGDKTLESAVSDMTLISGQKPVITKARKSIWIQSPRQPAYWR